jgi:hypothetical protein
MLRLANFRQRSAGRQHPTRTFAPWPALSYASAGLMFLAGGLQLCAKGTREVTCSHQLSSLRYIGVEHALPDQHTSAVRLVNPDSPSTLRMRLMGIWLDAARRDLRVALPYAERALALKPLEALRLLRPWRSDERLLREISGTRYSVGGDT